MASPQPTSKPSTTAVASRDFSVEVSADRLSAVLRVEASALGRAWDLAEVRSACDKVGLPLDEAAVAPLLQVKTRPEKRDRFVIATGLAAIDGAPSRLELTRDIGTIVSRGVEVGRLLSATSGQAGRDVFGREIPFRPAEPSAGLIGAGLEMDAERGRVLATENGCLSCKDGDGPPYVEPAMLLPGSPDRTLGPIESDQTIACVESIRDGADIRSKRSVSVIGAIEASQVVAGEDVTVLGGIVCRDHGSVAAGRDVSARFVHHSRVVAGRDLRVEKEIVGSEVICRGRLRAPGATLLSSRVTAIAGATVDTLGSDALARTTVEIGMDPRFQKLFEEQLPVIEASRKRIKHVRTMVEPLMQNQKRLTGAQKERATELLYDAETLQVETDQKLATLKSRYDELAVLSDAELVVQGVIHPGTTVRFPGVEALIRSTMQGPIRLRATGKGSLRRILAFVRDNPTGHPLETRLVPDDAMQAMQKLLAA